MIDSTRPPDATSFHDTAFGVLSRADLLPLEAEGVARGLGFVIENYADAELNPDLLLELHRISFGPIFPDWAGRYRTEERQTSSHKFPPHHLVPELVRTFFDDLAERLVHDSDPIDLVAWAQHRVIWIHPFNDYNGRTGRLFGNLLMLRLGLPLAEIAVEDEKSRKEYVAAMKSADNHDYGPLESLIRHAVEETEL